MLALFSDNPPDSRYGASVYRGEQMEREREREIWLNRGMMMMMMMMRPNDMLARERERDEKKEDKNNEVEMGFGVSFIYEGSWQQGRRMGGKGPSTFHHPFVRLRIVHKIHMRP